MEYGLTLAAGSCWRDESRFLAVETCSARLTASLISQSRYWGVGTRWTQLWLSWALSCRRKQMKRAIIHLCNHSSILPAKCPFWVIWKLSKWRYALVTNRTSLYQEVNTNRNRLTHTYTEGLVKVCNLSHKWLLELLFFCKTFPHRKKKNVQFALCIKTSLTCWRTLCNDCFLLQYLYLVVFEANWVATITSFTKLSVLQGNFPKLTFVTHIRVQIQPWRAEKLGIPQYVPGGQMFPVFPSVGLAPVAPPVQ